MSIRYSSCRQIFIAILSDRRQRKQFHFLAIISIHHYCLKKGPAYKVAPLEARYLASLIVPRSKSSSNTIILLTSIRDISFLIFMMPYHLTTRAYTLLSSSNIDQYCTAILFNEKHTSSYPDDTQKRWNTGQKMAFV